MKINLHMLPYQPFEHLDSVAQGVVEVQMSELHDLLAAEHEQLPDERASTAGRPADLLNRFCLRTAAVQLVLHNAGVPLNHRENVVEIVGHTGSQLTNGLHLLCLAKLALH